jgi:hypothetical protein
MKSEHRHELQTNDLGKFAEKAAVFIDVHGNRLMIGVCLACLPLAGLIYYLRSESNAQAAAWRDFSAAISAGKAEDFHAVWQDHPGTAPAYWARVQEGEHRLNLGVQSMFRNVETGTDELKKARDSFQAIIDNPRKAPPELRDRALLGLGRALESMSDGTEADAIKAYESLVKEFPNSIYKKDAEERIAILSKGSGQEFYNWFTKYPRPKLPVKGPHDPIGGGMDDEKTEEVLESFKSMDKGAGKNKSADDESLDLSDSEKPEGDKPPSEKKPADEKPVDKKPGGEAPDDADDKPAKPESKAESEPKPDSVPEPESKSDNE